VPSGVTGDRHKDLAGMVRVVAMAHPALRNN